MKNEERTLNHEQPKDTLSASRAPWPLFLVCSSFFFLFASSLRSTPEPPLDPAAWGGNRVGKPVPEFVGADTCLFCHRNDVGPSWGKNRHGQTVRPADLELAALARLKADPTFEKTAAEVKLVLGHADRVRFLKPSAEYGKLDLLGKDKPHWDTTRFADGCAGCHATAVNPKTRAFATASHDCFVCHGITDEKHSTDTRLVHLSRQRSDPPRVVTSICAQCHLREGKSKSTGLPYPCNFVPGDNLFQDFQVDFSDAALAKLNPGDRHVRENVRDVVLHGKEEVTCLTCHHVHKPSGKKHYQLPKGPLCWNCHEPNQSMKVRKAYQVHSKTCEY